MSTTPQAAFPTPFLPVHGFNALTNPCKYATALSHRLSCVACTRNPAHETAALIFIHEFHAYSHITCVIQVHDPGGLWPQFGSSPLQCTIHYWFTNSGRRQCVIPPVSSIPQCTGSCTAWRTHMRACSDQGCQPWPAASMSPWTAGRSHKGGAMTESCRSAQQQLWLHTHAGHTHAHHAQQTHTIIMLC